MNRDALNAEVVDRLVLLTEAVDQTAQAAMLINELSLAWVSYVTAIDGLLLMSADSPEASASLREHVAPVASGHRRTSDLLLEMKSMMTLAFELVVRNCDVPLEMRMTVARAIELSSEPEATAGVTDFARERLFRMPAIEALDELGGRISAACEHMRNVNAELAGHIGTASSHIREHFAVRQ